MLGVFAGILVFIGLLGIVSALVLLLIKLIGKKGWELKKTGILASAAIVMFVIGMVIAPPIDRSKYVKSNQDATPPVNSNANVNNVADTKPIQQDQQPAQQAASPPPFNWTTSDITQDTIKQALSQETQVKPLNRDSRFPGDIAKIEIYDNANKPGQKNILIRYTLESVWNETTFIKQAGGTAIFAANLLYGNSMVEDVTLFAELNMTDQYGKTAVQVGSKILLSRDLALKADWQSLAERHITDPGNIYRLARDYYIHPSIKKNINTSDVKL